MNKKLQSLIGQSTEQFIRNYRLNTARELLLKNRETKQMNIAETGCKFILVKYSFTIAKGSNQEVDMEKFHLAWQDYRVSPMGANLQLIFYRDKKNDILVKFLLNECEVTLPLKSKMVPYYSWKEVETFLAEIIGKE